MPALVTVTKTGNSATIALPSELRRANGIHIGDQVELVSRSDGIIELRKAKEGKDGPQAFKEALDFFKSTECNPWPGDCSKESDRDLMGGALCRLAIVDGWLASMICLILHRTREKGFTACDSFLCCRRK